MRYKVSDIFSDLDSLEGSAFGISYYGMVLTFISLFEYLVAFTFGCLSLSTSEVNLHLEHPTHPASRTSASLLNHSLKA
jgi:hypothetical protein